MVRLARSCLVGGRVRQVVCPGGGRAYTLAGFPSGNLRWPFRPVGRVHSRALPTSCSTTWNAGRSGSVVRLTVTPLGAKSASVGAVARSIVDYLEGGRGDPGSSMLVHGSKTLVDGAASYYADSIEGPGRWIGAGAAFRELEGVVEREAFERVLEGRHPMTGERLLTAQGSSQRGHLAVGTAERFDSSGQALYSEHDAARLLGLKSSEINDLVTAGVAETEHSPDDVGWIGSVARADGSALIPDAEITRHLDLAAAPVDPELVRSGGSPEDLLGAVEIARVLKVSRQYVRRLCVNGGRSSSETPGASLPSTRGEDGSYRVRRSDVADFAERRKPPVARVGFDLTLTVEKSIGLLAMLTSRDRQEAVVGALRRANDTAIGYLDRHASVARRKGSVVGSEGLMAASYLHGTSRALDPHPHHHNVVANAVVDDEGGVRTLDARALYRHAPAAAALATAAMRWELHDLGVGWWRRDDGVWEASGVADSAIREFSTRRSEMDEVRTALEERLGRRISHHEEDNVALSTRSAKQAVDPDDLRKEWLARADRVGLDIGSCFDRTDRAIAHDVLPDDLLSQLFEDLVDPDTGLCAESNTFGRGDVMRAIADWSIVSDNGDRVKVLVPPTEVERLSAQFCATDRVVQMDTATSVIRRRDGAVVSDGQDEPVFTTVELLGVEEGIVSAVKAGIGVGLGTADPEVVEDAIGSADRLSVEQADLVRNWLTSGDRVQCAVGRAGTGKTTTMRVAAEAWTSAGFRVLGASVKGEAARLLADDAGIESETVAMLLGRSDAGLRVLDARTVLIVDEASMIGDRDLLRLCNLARETGAVLRLIGDPAQHGSVPAGGSFNELVGTFAGRTPELTTVHRLTDDGERHRAQLVRDGLVDDAVTGLEASGQLVLTESEHETHAAMLARWSIERNEGRSHPMVHGRNRERRVLNTLAQQVRIYDGSVDSARAIVLADGRRLCVGDEVVARHGDRTIYPADNRAGWMRNGTTGVITSVRASGASPDLDEIDVDTVAGTISCPRSTFDRPNGGIDLAYAVTSYAVQGATNDVSTSAITASTSKSELYVDITRGRHQNQLYATRAVEVQNHDLDEHLPRVRSDLDSVLRTRMARSHTRTALGADPTAGDTARRSNARTLAGLVAAHRRGERSPTLDRAIANAEAAVRRVAEHDPPTQVSKILPRRPSSPHLANRWHETAADVAAFLAIEHPRIAHDQGGLPGVIGSRRSAVDKVRWDLVAQSIRDTATEIVCRQMVAEDPRSTVAQVVRYRPEWLTRYLGTLADGGALVECDIGRLATLVADVQDWRVEHDLIDNTTLDEPLGPTPADPLDRARQTQLARRLAPPRQRDPSRGIA